ncbi:MAG TPA: 2Fe-2S iron-sulfur cluster-binding protein [Gammaproteobacteria bacterium]|nr:2Fe-2S iron-sulfur cluster-binding protein [Gammaproteobacteria bacterium]|tara:strand:- start:99 stop:392 length:294 start_codon:yes stop_codon:yes gene_type:complete
MKYTIAFENGPTFACAAECAVTPAMKRAGVRATLIGCLGGGCGACRVRVIEGDYHTRRMSREHVTEADEMAGYALGCCLYPDSDLVVRAAPKSEQKE